MSLAGIQINVVLSVLNMLPVPPLDGGRVAVGLLPGKLSWKLSRLEPFGLVMVMALLLLPPLRDAILVPPVSLLMDVFYTIAE